MHIGGSRVFASTFGRAALATLGGACRRVSSPPTPDTPARYDRLSGARPFGTPGRRQVCAPPARSPVACLPLGGVAPCAGRCVVAGRRPAPRPAPPAGNRGGQGGHLGRRAGRRLGGAGDRVAGCPDRGQVRGIESGWACLFIRGLLREPSWGAPDRTAREPSTRREPAMNRQKGPADPPGRTGTGPEASPPGISATKLTCLSGRAATKPPSWSRNFIVPQSWCQPWGTIRSNAAAAFSRATPAQTPRS